MYLYLTQAQVILRVECEGIEPDAWSAEGKEIKFVGDDSDKVKGAVTGDEICC